MSAGGAAATAPGFGNNPPLAAARLAAARVTITATVKNAAGEGAKKASRVSSTFPRQSLDSSQRQSGRTHPDASSAHPPIGRQKGNFDVGLRP
jgi:hypothetical protein